MEIINIHQAKTQLSQLLLEIKMIIEDISNPVYVSAASVLEISTKFRIGKLPEASAGEGFTPSRFGRV